MLGNPTKRQLLEFHLRPQFAQVKWFRHAQDLSLGLKGFKKDFAKTFRVVWTAPGMPDDELAKRLEKLVEIAGSQRNFARIVGKSGPTVGAWLKGSPPFATTLAQIADRTGVSREWLILGEGDEETELGNFRRLIESGALAKRQPGRLSEDPGEYRNVNVTGGLKVKKLPIISLAQAGSVMEKAQGRFVSWEDVDDYEGVDTFAVKDSNAIAVRIRGDSMAPNYKEGTVAIIYPSVPPERANLVIARLKDGRVLFKRLHIVGDEYHFISDNPAYETLKVKREDIDRILTVGKTERDEI